MRTLSFRISLPHNGSPTSSALLQLCQEIERTPTIPHIDTLNFNLNWDNAQCNVLEAQEEVKQLDTLFTRKRFPRLRNVELYISLSSTTRLSYRYRVLHQRQEAVVNTYRQCLPTLAAMRGVELRCKTDVIDVVRRVYCF